MMRKKETMYQKYKKKMMKKKREEEMKRKKEKEEEKKPWNVDGIEFWTLTGLARHLETTPAKLKRLKKKYGDYEVAGRKYKEMMDMQVEGLAEGRSMTSEVIHFEGKNFMNFSVLCEYYDVHSSVVQARMKRGMSLEDALKHPIRPRKNKKVRLDNGKKVYIIGKEKYESLEDLLKAKGLTYNKLRNLYKEYGSYEEAIKEHEKGVRRKPRKKVVWKEGVMAFDRHYGSIAAVAEFHNVPHQSLRYRLKKGMSIEDAIEQLEEKKKKRDAL